MTRRFDSSKERGAALISTLLLSMLILAVGGMLLLTTTMTATNAFDSTSEMQAYYGAEAGLQAALNVIRGNKAALTGAGLPTGTSMRNNFVTSIDSDTSNYTGDPMSALDPKVRRLSAWLDYSYPAALSTSTSVADANRVVVMQRGASYDAGTDVAYRIEVSDPDNPNAPDDPPADYEPERILIKSIGYGPKGSIKQLEMMVRKRDFDLDAPATITVRGPDAGGSAMTFDIGNSNAKTYNGSDNASIAADKPAFAVTGPDMDVVSGGIHKPDTVTPQNGGNPWIGTLDVLSTVDPSASGVTPTSVATPDFLQNANNARELVSSMREVAQDLGSSNYYDGSDSGPSTIGTSTDPEFVFVDGDFTLGPGDHYGLLVVTGELEVHGNFSFEGIILVLGEGVFTRQGGGNGEIMGAVFVAKFGSTGNFEGPTFDTSGGGNSHMQFDTNAVNNALNAVGRPVAGVVER